MARQRQSSVRFLEKALETYLLEHPAAADTLDGIARWWLPQQEPEHPEDLSRALENLAIRGVLHRHILPGGSILYTGRLIRDAHLSGTK